MQSLIASLALASARFSLDSETHSVHYDATGKPYEVTQRTYYSDAITLKAGHMIFTRPRDTPLKMPEGRYALTYFIGDIVYADTRDAVPLTQVYDHHWIARSTNHRNQLCHGGLEYVFGIGAESRNSPVVLPDGFGYVVEAGTKWGANIHLLRTEGLAGADKHRAAKECNECYYAPFKGAACTPARNGTFACCGERDPQGTMKCATALFPPPPRAYRLRYTFNFTTAVAALTPVQIGTMSAPDCATFYAVERNESAPVHRASYELRVPARASVLFAVGHLHVGGLNLSLSLNGRHVCTSVPTYGTTPDAPGDELGYLVRMSPCIDANASGAALQLAKGDVLRIEGRYYRGRDDARVLYSDGTHLNVMSYLYTMYYRPADSLAADEDADFWRAPQPLPPGERQRQVASQDSLAVKIADHQIAALGNCLAFYAEYD